MDTQEPMHAPAQPEHIEPAVVHEPRYWLVTIIVAVLLAAVVGAGVWWWMDQQIAVQKQAIENQITELQQQMAALQQEKDDLVMAAEQVASEQSVSTEGWQTYQNEKYGYTIQYPNDFTIFIDTNQETQEVIAPDSDSTEVFIIEDKDVLFVGTESIISVVKVIAGNIDTEQWQKYVNIPDYRVESERMIIFSDRDAYEVIATAGIDSEGARAIFIPGDDVSYVVVQADTGDVWEAITNSFALVK